MHNDLRRSADPRKANTPRMILFAKVMTLEEIESSARYFSSMPWSPWVRVVETRMVPKTRAQSGVFFPLPGSDTDANNYGKQIDHWNGVEVTTHRDGKRYRAAATGLIMGPHISPRLRRVS